MFGHRPVHRALPGGHEGEGPLGIGLEPVEIGNGISEPDKALGIYSSALPLLAITESELVSASTPISSSGKLNFTSFTRFRELWRWVESIIWRAVSLGSRICDISREDTHNTLWTWLTHYSTCSSCISS